MYSISNSSNVNFEVIININYAVKSTPSPINVYSFETLLLNTRGYNVNFIF